MKLDTFAFAIIFAAFASDLCFSADVLSYPYQPVPSGNGLTQQDLANEYAYQQVASLKPRNFHHGWNFQGHGHHGHNAQYHDGHSRHGHEKYGHDIHIIDEPISHPAIYDEIPPGHNGNEPILKEGITPHFPNHHYGPIGHGKKDHWGHKNDHWGHGGKKGGPIKDEKHYHEGADDGKKSAYSQHHRDVENSKNGKHGSKRSQGLWDRHNRNRQWLDKSSKVKKIDNDRKVGIRRDARTDRENWNRDKEGGHERVWHWDKGFGNKKRWHHHLGDWLEKDQKGEKKRWNEEEHAVKHVEDRAKKQNNKMWKDRRFDERHNGYGQNDNGHRYDEKKKHGVEVHRVHREKHSPKVGSPGTHHHGGHHNWDNGGHEFDFIGHGKDYVERNSAAAHH